MHRLEGQIETGFDTRHQPNNHEPRILISRLSAIGDCIETLPLANAVKDQWPKSHITWVVDCAANTLLNLCPAIDVIHRIRKGFLKRPIECFDLRRRLRSSAIDIAIDPQGLTKSAILAWISGARRRIGFAKPQSREIAPWFYTDRISPTATHLIDKQMELLRPLGIVQPKVCFGLRMDSQALSKMDKFLLAQQLYGKEFLIINPGAGWPSRLWPAERYGQLAANIFASHQIKSVVVWAGAIEECMADTICQLGQTAVIKAPNTSLPELGALLQRSTLFIGSDSGPMHLASALTKPCVGLFGPTQPQASGPYGPGHITIQTRYQSGTSRQRRSDSNDAMREISVEQVTEACRKRLSQYNPASS